MKKIYFLGFALLSLGAFAQKSGVSSKLQHQPYYSEEAPMNITFEANKTQAPLDTLWSENFSSFGWTLAGADSNVWRRTTKGANGCYSAASVSTINSPTKANGFMIFNADSANKVGLNANCSGSSMKAFTGSIISPTINLSAAANVLLSFNWTARYCCVADTNVLVVSVSGDNGTTWRNYSVVKSLGVNKQAALNAKEYLNISSVAGGKSQVKIKFSSKMETYYVEIDDVTIQECSNNDLYVMKNQADFTWLDYYFNTQMPITQLDTIWCKSQVRNIGSATQHGVRLDVSLNDGTNTIKGTLIDSIPALAPEEETYVNTYVVLPQAVKTYTMTFNVKQTETDEVANAGYTRQLAVSDSSFARDHDFSGTQGSSLFFRYGACSIFTSQCGVAGFRVGNDYLLVNPDKISTMSFFLHDSTQIGASLVGQVYFWDGTALVKVAETQPYDVTSAADKNKWITLGFAAGPYTAAAGEYVVVVEFSNTKRIYVGGEDTDLGDGTRFFFYNNKWWVGSYNAAIRLNVNKNVGLPDKINGKLAVSQNMPNPTNGLTNVNYTLTDAANVTVDIYDISGKKVMSALNERMSAGSHSLTINTASLNAGIYFYTFTAGNNSITQKMTVVK